MFRRFPALFYGVENKNKHLVKLLYSSLYFAISFILLSYTSHAWSTSNAWDFGYRAWFSYDGMENLQNTRGWTVTKVAWVYLAPPLWGLLISLISILGFYAIDPRQTHLRTFLFWLCFNGFLLFYSYVITGFISGQEYSSKFFSGFMGFYSWLEWPSATVFAILAIQAFAFLTYSFLFSKPVLHLNYSRNLAVKKRGKSIIFINIVILPYLLGSLLVVVSTFPMDWKYQVVRFASFLPIFIMAYIGMGFYKAKHINIIKGGLKYGSVYGYAVGAILLILFARLVLSLRMNPLW